MRRLSFASTIALLLCGRASGEIVSLTTADDLTAVRAAATAFAVTAYTQADKGDSNFVFSPFSISIGLGIAYGGAHGETEKELATAMQTALGQSRYHAAFADLRGKINASLKTSRVNLRSAKIVACQTNYPLQESFVSLARNSYGGEIAFFDFQHGPSVAVQQLNTWIGEQTHGRITGLVPATAISADTRLAILTALYFKADWAGLFDAKQTKSRPFWISEKTSTGVSTMYQKEKLAYGETPSAQVLELPYKGFSVSMLIVLPKEKGGLKALESKLSTADIVSWVTSLAPADKYEVETYLPRFELETDMDITQVLCAMGAPRMFSPTEADFSGMSSRTPLFISTALHKAGIKVDETGTEARAATGYFTTLGGEFEIPPTKIFRADHPFLFCIIDKTNGVILFMGRVMNPNEK